jgi:hypothetical protein
VQNPGDNPIHPSAADIPFIEDENQLFEPTRRPVPFHKGPTPTKTLFFISMLQSG